MLVVEVGRTFERHATANVRRRFLDLLIRKPEPLAKDREVPVRELVVGQAERTHAEGVAEHEAVEDERELERAGKRLLDARERLLVEALGLERGAIHVRGLVQRAGAFGVRFDRGDLFFGVAEAAQRRFDRLVDDLKVTAAGQLLELYQREVGLDPRRVAVHDQADRSGRRDDRRLGVAETGDLADGQGVVPRAAREGPRGLREERGRMRRRRNRQALEGRRRCLIGGAAVVADHAKHGFGVGAIAGKRAELARHLGRAAVGRAGEQRGNCGAPAVGLFRIVRESHAHEQRAEVGIAEPERPEVVGFLCDDATGELGHQDAHFEGEGPNAAGFRERRRVELAVPVLERDQVEAGKITRGVVQEHVLRAVVHDDAVGDEVMGVVLGEIVDRLRPGRFERCEAVGHRKRIRALDRREKVGKRASLG